MSKHSKILHKYAHRDFIEQQRVFFVYYAILVVLVTDVLLIISTSYLHVVDFYYGIPYKPILIPMYGLIVVLLICLVTLKKGYYTFSATLLLTASAASIWMVMLMDDSGNLIQLDTIVFLFATFTMLPLIIKKDKRMIIIFSGTNYLVFLVFMFGLHDSFDISEVEFRDYLIDVTTAIFFISTISYYMFVINRAALNRANRDIAKRKEAEGALAESEKRYREMTELLPITVFETDLQGVITYINEKGLRFFNYDQEEIKRGISLFQTVKNQEKGRRFLAELHERRQTVSEYFTISRKINGPCPVRIYANVLGDESAVTGYRGVIVDISEQVSQKNEIETYKNHLEDLVESRTSELHKTNRELKVINKDLDDQKAQLQEALEELKNAQQQLVQKEKMASLGILTAGVAHELNNPLNFILGGHQGMVQYFDEHQMEDEELKMLLSSIKTGIDRANEIVAGLNHFSRDLRSYDEQCDIHYILDTCLLMLNKQVDRQVNIERDYTSEALPFPGNVGKLHQVFLNILTNALQSLDGKGEVSITTLLKENYLEVAVTDTGKGIKQEDLPRVTDPFFTTKEPGEGTGLGLFITYTIIQNHGGKLEVDSEPGRGTRVSVKLPLKRHESCHWVSE